MVDGVLASCYAFSDHDLAHIGLTPIRWFPGIIDWVFGEDQESPVYLMVADQLTRWVLHYGLITRNN